MDASDENLSSSAWDQKRIAAYDLYENIYRNALITLQIVIRDSDQTPVLMPNGRKIVEATERFLAKNVDYLVDNGGDESARTATDEWFDDFFKREAFKSKFDSNKRWGLIRGDAYFYVYAKDRKVQGKRLCVKELDPRQVFEIEDSQNELIGVHIVDKVQDFRSPDKPDKKIVRRRTFRRIETPSTAEDTDDEAQVTITITSQLTFWEIGKWDDRTDAAKAKQERVPNTEFDEDEYELPDTITQLPVYKWSNNPSQNSTWGTSQLAGLETLLYALNQSLSDEDAILVFQGLGMYVTNAAPPLDPNTLDVTDWNIGPKQIIEISGDQKFERVTGVSDVSPLQEHMKFIDDGMCEASGTPLVSVGRVDVQVAESGISLQLQLMPLLAANAEKEEALINLLDQMYHDITTMWLPGYETEMFGEHATMQEITVLSLFDDAMPVDRDKEVTEVVTLDQGNLILKSMAVAKLRELGWKYPTTDAQGQPLTDDDIAAMLLDQSAAVAAAQDPFSLGGGGGTDANGNPLDENGNPVDQTQPQQNTPGQQTVDIGVTQ